MRMFSTVWWRASTDMIDAAAVRTCGSVMRCAAPRYAETPTFSTIRAVLAMVVTSVKTSLKSNVQPVMGSAPRAWISSCINVSMGEGNYGVVTYLENRVVRRLVALDRLELLDGERRIDEAGFKKVLLDEGTQRLRVELGLELLEHVRKFCPAALVKSI